MRKALSFFLLLLFLIPIAPASAMGVDVYVNGEFVGRGSNMMNPQMTRSETYVNLYDVAAAMDISAGKAGDLITIGGKHFSAEKEGAWDIYVPASIFTDNFGWYIDPESYPRVNLVYAGDLEEIKVYVNGSRLQPDQPPIVIAGRTFVPIRAIFEHMGATVEFNHPNVIARKSDTSLIMYPERMETLIIKSFDTYAMRADFMLETPPVIKNDRTLAPLRAVGELLGATVHWDEATRAVTINGQFTEFIPPEQSKVWVI